MPLTELLPAVSQLTHQDKLRLIHFLLLAVAKEEGCELQPTETQAQENALLSQLVPLRGIQNAKFKVKNCCCARILSVLNSRLISALVY